MAVVAGGGLAGLSVAHYISKKYCGSNLKLVVLEASERFGGWIKSDVHSNFLFESGPRTIRPAGDVGANTLNLIEDIGLSNSIVPIPSDHVAARNRMIYVNKKLHLLPSSFFASFVTKPPFSKPLFFYFLNDLKAKPKLGLQDDSIYNFVNRRFGKEIADYAISPMICGICAGDAKEISVKFLLKNFFEMEQEHGGIIKAMFKKSKKQKQTPVEMGELAKLSRDEKWSIYSMKEGLEELPKGLEKSLIEKKVQLYPKHKIQEIAFYNDNKKVNVIINDEYAFCSNHLFSCLPSYELGELLQKSHPQLADDLKSIPFVNVGVVNLKFNSENLLKQDAFGFLVSPMEKLPILGVIYDSCCFSHQKGTVVTVMMGGKWFEEYFGENPSEDFLLDVAITQVKNILNINEQPEEFKVNILKKCIPQYIVGHHDRVKKLRKYIEDKNLPLSLCGSSYDGVGVNDVIMSAYSAVKNGVLT